MTSPTSPISPISVIKRDALRSVIRRHPDGDLLWGPISNQPLDKLYEAVTALQIPVKAVLDELTKIYKERRQDER